MGGLGDRLHAAWRHDLRDTRGDLVGTDALSRAERRPARVGRRPVAALPARAACPACDPSARIRRSDAASTRRLGHRAHESARPPKRRSVTMPPPVAPPGGAPRRRHRLLILVVLGTALWISAQHNKLALEVVATADGERDRVHPQPTYTLVSDYSLWNEGFAAVLKDDREWLFSSIGSSVTELDTFDLAILVPDARTNFGWIAGSPPEGEADILPQRRPRRDPRAPRCLGTELRSHADPDRRVPRRAVDLRGRAHEARGGHPAGGRCAARCRSRSTGRA